MQSERSIYPKVWSGGFIFISLKPGRLGIEVLLLWYKGNEMAPNQRTSSIYPCTFDVPNFKPQWQDDVGNLCHANPKPDASSRLLPCQSLRRDEHMGTGMGMMLILWPTFTNNNVCLYTSALVPRIFTSSYIFSEAPYPVHRLHNHTQITGWPRQLSHWCRHSVVWVQS
jgi:hypothetical protein